MSLPPLTIRPSSGARAVAVSSPRLDEEDYGESLVKWAWLAGMLYVLACFLPAISGGHASNRPWTMAGWEMGYLAHAAVWNFTDGGPMYMRRIRPLTETQALCVAGAAVLSNWLLLAACVMAYLGHRYGEPRKWAAYALRSSVYAALLGTSATAVWVVARNLAPQVGCVMWCAAPYVLALGLYRLRRAAG